MRSTSCLGTIMRLHRPRVYMLRLQNKPRVRPSPNSPSPPPHPFPCIPFAPQTRIPLTNTIYTKLDVTPSTAPPKPGNSKTEVPSADLYPPSRHNFLPLVLRHILPSSRVMVVNRQQQQQRHHHRQERLQLHRRRRRLPRVVVRIRHQVVRME